MKRSIERCRILSRCSLYLLGLIGLTVFASTAGAQVFNSGPSIGPFDEYISVPSAEFNPNLGDNLTFGGNGTTIRLDVFEEGSVGDFFTAESGCEVNIRGNSFGIGYVGIGFSAQSGSEINIRGGTVGSGFEAHSGSQVNIYSGSVDEESFRANSGSEINLLGRNFFLDGKPLFDRLTVNATAAVGEETYTIADRGVTLEGLLADGTPLSFDLNSDATKDNFFASDATITVSLVPPQGVLLGDVNNSAHVTFFDILPFIGVLMDENANAILTGEKNAGNARSLSVAGADCNLDGYVNFLDIDPFIRILAGEANN